MKLEDGTEQKFECKEMSWYEQSILADDNTLLRFQQLCTEKPTLTPELMKRIPPDEGRRLLEFINKLNEKEKKA